MKDFCDCEFWVTARNENLVDGKDLVGFQFTRLEGVDLPVLMLFSSDPFDYVTKLRSHPRSLGKIKAKTGGADSSIVSILRR